MEFQSTLRRTERLSLIAPKQKYFAISIHAPTNGATSSQAWIKLNAQNFNPRSDERSDFFPCPVIIWHLIFQSTLRRTERRCKIPSVLSDIRDFNPRSDERSDYQHSRYNKLTRDFNPRSDERSDYSLVMVALEKCKFQSTLRRTERLLLYWRLVWST